MKVIDLKKQSKNLRFYSFVIFNDCQDMLKNVDEIIGRPFPNNGVFNWRLTNLQPFFLDYNQIARLKVSLKVVLNLIGPLAVVLPSGHPSPTPASLPALSHPASAASAQGDATHKCCFGTLSVPPLRCVSLGEASPAQCSRASHGEVAGVQIACKRSASCSAGELRQPLQVGLLRLGCSGQGSWTGSTALNSLWIS